MQSRASQSQKGCLKTGAFLPSLSKYIGGGCAMPKGYASEIPGYIRRRPYYIIAPGLIILIGIMIPFAVAIFLSFTNFSFRNPKFSLVGFKNWIRMFSSKVFWHALFITLLYGIGATTVQMLLGTGIALLLKKDTLYGRILKVLFTFPLMVAPDKT